MNRYQAHAGTGLRWPVYSIVAYLMLAMSGLVVWGQPRSNIPPVSNRYLFLVETSRTMQPRTEGTLTAIESLLTSGMQGQMHSNDTIGVWTFNHKLYAENKFPLQQWTGSNQNTVSAAVTAFLNQQKYEKSPDFTQVFPTLEEVVKNSDFITIVLFSSGESLIKGTAFDEKINAYFKDWRNVQQKAHMPFITVLRAEKGVINDYSMNSAPWPVHLSPLPAALVAAYQAEARAASPPPPPKPASAPAVAPLYFSGRKSEPTTGTLYFSGPNKVESVPPTPTPAPGQSSQAGTTTQSSPTLDLGQGGPQPNAHGTALGETSPSSPESHPVSAQALLPQTQATAQPEAPAMAAPPAPRPQAQSGGPPESPAVTPAPPAPKPQTQPENSSSAPAAADTHPVSAAPAASETATAVPAVRGFVGPLIWVLAGACGSIGACLILLRRRKSHSGSQASFITRSYNRNQPKP